MSILLEPLETRSRFEMALPPMLVTAAQTGPSVELPDGDGPVIAVVQTGAYSDESALAVTFQESDAGSTWATIAGSGVPGLTPESAALHSFPRTKRYLRCQVAVTGADPTATLAVLVGQGYKVF